MAEENQAKAPESGASATSQAASASETGSGSGHGSGHASAPRTGGRPSVARAARPAWNRFRLLLLRPPRLLLLCRFLCLLLLPLLLRFRSPLLLLPRLLLLLLRPLLLLSQPSPRPSFFVNSMPPTASSRSGQIQSLAAASEHRRANRVKRKQYG